MHIHVVKRGDTLSSIAAMHDALPAFVAADNGLALSTPLVIGQALVVRTPKTLHTVRAGETLSSIARDYDLSVRTLLRRNFFLHGRELLREGDVLAIDYADEAPLGTLGVNAYAYALLSKAANAVFLMTYEWGYVYGEPQAIAPLPQVCAVLDYALSVTAGENIFLGAPLYAYDWPLPYEKGRTRAETFSSQAAVARARLVGAEIEFDETARSPYYHYFDKMRREHAVWFEDARSLRAKIALAAEKGLQGIGFWQAGRELAQAWPLLDALLTLETL